MLKKKTLSLVTILLLPVLGKWDPIVRNKSVFELLLWDMPMKSLDCQLKWMALVMVYTEIFPTEMSVFTVPN